MDDHARRVCAPLLQAWNDFENDHATLLDLSRLAEQSSSSLDNATAPLPELLRTASNELESAYHTNEQEDHLRIGRRIMGPVIASIDP